MLYGQAQGARAGGRQTRCRWVKWRPGWGPKEVGGGLGLGGDSGDAVDVGIREMKAPRMTAQLGLEQDWGQSLA